MSAPDQVKYIRASVNAYMKEDYAALLAVCSDVHETRHVVNPGPQNKREYHDIVAELRESMDLDAIDHDLAPSAKITVLSEARFAAHKKARAAKAEEAEVKVAEA